MVEATLCQVKQILYIYIQKKHGDYVSPIKSKKYVISWTEFAPIPDNAICGQNSGVDTASNNMVLMLDLDENADYTEKNLWNGMQLVVLSLLHVIALCQSNPPKPVYLKGLCLGSTITENMSSCGTREPDTTNGLSTRETTHRMLEILGCEKICVACWMTTWHKYLDEQLGLFTCWS